MSESDGCLMEIIIAIIVIAILFMMFSIAKCAWNKHEYGAETLAYNDVPISYVRVDSIFTFSWTMNNMDYEMAGDSSRTFNMIKRIIDLERSNANP
jgi:hypothetical protein